MQLISRIQELNKPLRYLVYLLILFVAGFVLPFLSWLVGDESFTATSDANFCVGCHSMEPFVLSNADALHGGDNDFGIKASCATCHLPHENSAGYLYAKARTGLHDIFVEVFRDTSKIDWKAKSEFREEFVYDSGCMTCHSELEAATMDEKDHRNYFQGITDSQCVTCHEEVGHSNLNKYLLQSKYE